MTSDVSDDSAIDPTVVTTPRQSHDVSLHSTVSKPNEQTSSQANDPHLAATVVRTSGESSSKYRLAAGDRFGDYEILGEIARGGMGVVYRARQISLNRRVALKMILSAHIATSEDVVRFRTEAEAAARLEHPGIVPIYEIGEVDGQHYFSMGLVEGGSLDKLMTSGPLGPDRAGALVKSIADAVHYAHSRNIVHRDLKPANVLLDEHQQPKITDFGLAKDVQHDSGLTATGQVMGTPSYMSPEQASGRVREVGPPADVYALGAILYAMTTGRPPFKGNNVVETLQLVLSTDPIAPRQLNARIDLDLETICLKCLEKDPIRRYSSAAALSEDLTKFLERRPISARPISNRERLWRWCRRNPFAAGLVGVSLVSVLLFGIGLYYREQAAASAKAISAANEVARTQQFYASWNQAREIRAEATPGWTWDCLKHLDQALSFRKPTDRPQDVIELRSLALQSLSSFDMRLDRLLLPHVDASCTAFSPDGKFLAVGENKAGQSCTVHLIPLSDPEDVVKLTVSNLGGNLLRFVQGTGSYADALNIVSFSPDGRWIRAGTRYGMIHTWDLASKPPARQSWRASDQPVNRLAQSSLDQILFVRCREKGKLYRWSLSEIGKELPPLDLETPIDDFAMSHDGRLLAVSAHHTRLFDAVTLNEIRGWPAVPRGSPLRFSRHDRLLAISTADGIQIVDVRTGEVVRKLVPPDDASLSVGFNAVFSTSDAHLIGLHDEIGIHVWDMASGKLTQSFPVSRAFGESLSVSPSGNRLAVGTQAGTQLLELRDQAIQESLGVSGAEMVGVAWAPNSSRVVLSSRIIGEASDDEEVAMWDLESRAPVAQHVFHGSKRWAFRPFLHDGQLSAEPKADRLASVSRHLGPILWKLDQDQLTATHCVAPKDRPGMLQVPAGELSTLTETDPSALGGRAVRLTKNGTSRPVTFQLAKLELPAGPDRRWSFLVSMRCTGAPMAQSAAQITTSFGEERPTVIEIASHRTRPGYHWYLAELELQSRLGPHSAIRLTVSLPEDAADGQDVWIDRLLFAPLEEDRNQLRVLPLGPICLGPNSGRLWGIVDETTTLPNEQAPATSWGDLIAGKALGDEVLRSLAVGPKIVAVGARRGIVQLLSSTTGEAIGLIDGPGGSVQAVAIDPAERWLAIGTELGRLRIWNLEQSSLAADLEGHTRSINCLAFSRDGGYLVSGSSDKTVRLWRRSNNTLEAALVIKGFSGSIQQAAFNAVGTRLATLVAGELAVRIWNLEEIERHLSQRLLGMNSAGH